MFWRELPFFFLGLWALALGWRPAPRRTEMEPEQKSAEILQFPTKKDAA